jgi:hypothetical protein
MQGAVTRDGVTAVVVTSTPLHSAIIPGLTQSNAPIPPAA